MNDTYLERVAICRVPGREMTLRKRLAEITREATRIRAEMARLRELKSALKAKGVA